MALYQDPKYLSQKTHAAFDTLHNPGEKTPDSGIFRCEGCGHEIGIADNKTLPPQNHHQHSNTLVPIRWRLIVAAVPVFKT